MIPDRFAKYEQIMTVACVNFKSTWGNKAANLAKIKGCIVEAAAVGSNLVVFPELALSGYECSPECGAEDGSCAMHEDAAELIPGPSTIDLGELARQHRIYVILGMPERDKTDPSVRYNSAPLIGPEGIVGVYRKLHLASAPAFTENLCFKPGDDLPVFETRYGPIGILICYDFWRHPELSRILALKGARLILNATASPSGPGNIEFMSVLTKARATENYVYTISANLVGVDRSKSFFGRSTIAGPVYPRLMPLCVEAGDEEQLITATLNFQNLHRLDELNHWKKERHAEVINRHFKELGES